MVVSDLSPKKVKVQKAIQHFMDTNPGAVPQLSPPFKIRFKLKDGEYVTHDIEYLLLIHNEEKSKNKGKGKSKGGAA